MALNIDVSEETLKEVLKAAGVAVATLSTKYLYRGIKFLWLTYNLKKDVNMSMTWGQHIKLIFFAGSFGGLVGALLVSLLK